VSWEQWVASRPESVQKLAKEFPPGTRIKVRGQLAYLIGYTEGDSLIFSIIDPNRDFDKSMRDENKRYVCAKHFRDGAVCSCEHKP
jgi:hypothetical protein